MIPINDNAHRETIEERLTQLIAKTARMEPESLDRSENLIEMGADSIILTDVNSYIREEFRVDIPLTLFFEELTSIAEIAAYIQPRVESSYFSPPRIEPSANGEPALRAAAPSAAPLLPTPTLPSTSIPTAGIAPLASPSPIPLPEPAAVSVEPGLAGLFSRQLDIIHHQIQVLAGASAAFPLASAPASATAAVAQAYGSAAVLAPEVPAADREPAVPAEPIAEKNEIPVSQPYIPYKKIDTQKKATSELQNRHIAELMKRYIAKTSKSKAFAASYRLPYADWRNISGFRPAIKEMVYQLVFSESRGSHITDIDGNDYIDLTMDFGATLFGHNEPFIREAIAEEMEKGFPLSLITSLSGEVAELICEFTGNERVSFFNSGTEAVMVAMRLARAATGRDKIVMFAGAYHGTFDGVLGMHPLYKETGAASPIAGGIPQSYIDDLLILDYDDPKSLEFIAEHAHEIAAVLVEPVQSRRPDLQPREFLHALRDLTLSSGIQLIFDEMILGFRLGTGGAQAFFDVRADLVTYGKIVGGGMPIGIVAGKSDVMDGIDGGAWNYGDESIPPHEDRRTFAGGTFCHHPLAMAAARAVLLRIKRDADMIYEPLNRRTRFLADSLNAFFEAEEIPVQIVYCGSLFRFMLRGNMEMFYYHLLDKGVYIWEGRNCFLSAAHTDEDIDRVIEAVKNTCLEMKGVFFGKKETPALAVRSEAIALSAEQRKMSAFEAINPETSAFHQAVRMQVEGAVDYDKLRAAAARVAGRHEALRTYVSSDRESLLVRRDAEAELTEHRVPPERLEAAVGELLRQPFDMEKGPLFRLHALTGGEESAGIQILVIAHHLVMDGWSVSLFCEEWISCYNELAGGGEANLAEPMAYSDYANARFSASPELRPGASTDRFERFDTEVRLPRSDSRGIQAAGRGERITHRADEALLRKARKAAAAAKCSPFLFFLSAYQMTIREITGQSRFVLGVPAAGQQALLPKALMGNCVSILPVPAEFHSQTTLAALASANRALFGGEAPAPSDDRLKLNAVFNMDRMPKVTAFSGTTLHILPLPTDQVMYDLFLNIVEFDGGLVFDLDFDRDLFTTATARRWLRLYIETIDRLCQNPMLAGDELYSFSGEDAEIASDAAEALGAEALFRETKLDPADYGIFDHRVKALIVNEQAQPVITGTYGYLQLGPSRIERYSSNWLARIDERGILEPAGPAEDCFFAEGVLYSPWRIANELSRHPDLSNVQVSKHPVEEELQADFYTESDEATADSLTRWCARHLPRAAIPRKFYRRSAADGYAEPVLLERIHTDRSPTESWLAGVVAGLIGTAEFSEHDNLISLGLHSLGLLQMISAIHERFAGLTIPLNQLAASPTVSGIASMLDAWTESPSERSDHAEFKRIEEAEYYATSPAQQRMYLLHGIEPESLNYNMPVLIEIEGEFDPDRFASALNRIVERHENLRTGFAERDGEVVQYVRAASPISVAAMQPQQGESTEVLTERMKSVFVKPFDLAEGPLLRAAAAREEDGKTWLLLDFHHIVFDGASSIVLARELTELYEGRELPDLAYQYKDFAAWQQEARLTESMRVQERFWRDRLIAAAPSGAIAADLTGSEEQTGGGVVRSIIKPELKQEVQRLCRAAGCTPYTFFLAVLNAVVSMHAGRPDVTIGTLVEGRNHPRLDSLIGMFVNTLPIGHRIDAEQTFEELLSELQSVTLDVFSHADVPFDRIVELSGAAGTKARNPLFDILFSYQSFGELSLHTEGTVFRYKELVPDDCKFDIEFEVVDQADGYEIVVQYARNLYLPDTIERLLGRCMAFMRDALAAPHKRLGELEMTSSAERWQILHQFNAPSYELTPGDGLLPRFEHWAQTTPDQTAVIFGEQRLSYRELNERVNRLARYLSAAGVGPEIPVGLMMERSPDMIASILAVWKAGGAYIPIDKEHPLERRLNVLEEAGCSFVLSRGEIDSDFIRRYSGATIELDRLRETLQDFSSDNLDPVWMPEGLAYILFTSGSTGKPKGVMIEHAGMFNHILAEQEALGLGADLVFAQNAGHCFDISVWQMVGALALGGTTAIYANELVLQPDRFLENVHQDGVTLLEVVPSYLSVLMDQMEAEKENRILGSTLKHVMITGEAVRPDLAARWLALRPDVPVVNAYGPAEASDDVAQFVTRHIPEGMPTLPIGRPLPNVRIYILDPQGRLCPPGVAGELCVAGIAVGRGYVRDAERTARAFAEDPFAETEPGRKASRLYRTGDLGSWTADGSLLYLGRIDEQIKIRGHRIEPGEIEYRLRRQAPIADAVVVARQDASGESYLCAYVIAAQGADTIDMEQVRAELRDALPDYMVPAHFMTLERFPVGATGKLDRRALPEPERNAAPACAMPRNPLEENLLNIFKEVLGAERIGVDDDFFAIGGHSLRATKLVNLIERDTGCRLSLKEVFAHSSAAELALSVERSRTEGLRPIPAAESKPYYPMSPAQKRLFLIHRMEEPNTVYNMPGILEMRGEWDAKRIEEAFEALIARHESLRTRFGMIDGIPVQQIEEAGKSLTPIEYAQAEEGTSAEEALRAFVRPFDLEAGPPIRMKVVRTSAVSGFVLFDMHHIISDGATINLIAQDFASFYNGERPSAHAAAYRDYSEWLNTLDQSREREYWARTYAEDVPRLDLPLDLPRAPVRSFEGAVHRTYLSRQVAEAIARLGQHSRATEYMILLGAFMLLAAKYAKQDDLIVGSPVSGRTHPDIEHTAGMFVNTLALRGRPESKKSWLEFLGELRETCLQAYDHQQFPFEELVEMLEVERDMSRNPLFDLMFVLQNNEETKFVAEPLRLGEMNADTGIAKFDLTLTAIPYEEGYALHWEYCTALLRPDTIERMALCFEQLLTAVLAEPDIRIADIETVPARERERLLNVFNPERAAYPSTLTIKEAFERQVESYPDRIAVCDENERLTYAELNRRANLVARRLREYGTEEAIAGLVLNRSAKMLAAVLGAVKAGIAYLPIDPDAPADRISYLLEDSGVRLLICGRETGSAVPNFDGTTLELEEMLGSEDLEDPGNPESGPRADSALYVIYTSGTTGNPKGTVVEHRNVVSLLLNDAFPFDFDERDVWSLFHLYTFDFSVWEMYGALLRGGKLVVVSKEATRDSGLLLDLLRKEQVTVLNQVPSSFYELMHAEQSQRSAGAPPLAVRHLIFGGEALDPARLRSWHSDYPRMNLVNMYGITETTVHVTYQQIGVREIESASRSIGRPIPTLSLYIMNGDKLCGIGMRGELCVAGEGVARGYLHRPELTEQRFAPHPFRAGERLYRSGDLGRWLPDGSIEYLGRMDDQVKIRGYRIELGEIENIFRKQKGVRDVAVLVRTDRAGDKAICAYLVGDPQYGEFDPEDVKRQIACDLPAYMIPAFICVLDKMPITVNGKLDRKNLPEPEFAGRSDYAEPRDDKERAMTEVFEHVLGMDRIGIDDNFFELGGDSIKAIRVVSKLREAGYDLSVRNLMMGRTIREIAERTVPAADNALLYAQEPFAGEVALTPIQHEFYRWKLARPDHYNQSIMLHARGVLNPASLRASLAAIVGHHDMLRAVFTPEGAQAVRSAETDNLFELQEFDLLDLPSSEAYTRIEQEASLLQSMISLENGPLLKAGLFRTEAGDHLLLIAHHLVIDGVSWRILLEDLEEAYRQSEEELPIELPLKTASYGMWSEALHEYAYSETFEREIPYWQEVEERASALGRKESSSADVEELAEKTCFLSAETTEKLLHRSGQAYQTQINDLLLAALVRTVKSWDGRSEILLELEGHGREALHRQVAIDRTIGWFTSIFPVILRSDGSIGDDICETKETLRRVPNRGIGYGVLRHLRGESVPSAQAEFCFNYLGQLDIEQEEDRLFRMSECSAGDNSSPANRAAHPFTLNVSVLNEQLNVEIQYETGRYTREKADRFGELFIRTLSEIVEHCAEKDSVRYTASDFGDLDLEMDEFSEIMKSYT